MRREGSSGAGIASGGAVAVATVIVGLLLLPVVYALSLGPAVWLCEHNYLSEPTAEAAYTPLIFAAENCHPLEVALESYMHLWEPDVATPPCSTSAAPALSAPLPPAAAQPSPVPTY